MPRLLIVSNRLPITVRLAEGGAVSVEPSTGGLATGMKGPHERLRGLWIGWPGDLERLSDGARREVDRRLAELRLAGVPLSADEIARYYEGYSNAILWPLFHYSVARLPNEVSGFDTYEQVNARFADEVAARWQPGDLVWIHDYQLMLVPAMLRERVPDARIGFFLHIPFPSSEIFRLLPQRERLLEGLLGADLLGFHTATYLRHFASAALRLVGATTEVDRLRWQGREVRMGVFPMGIDAAHFSALASSPEVEELVASHRREGHQLLLGLDRLDYTKGIQRRLLAFEALLRAHPELTRKVRLVQVAVPSRENVEAYRELREEVDALVGRIHGEFATPDWSPIHYLYRGLSQAEIVALYRATDAVLVTPLRDGMNLVAKEFVAARSDGDGVLVLSEFAGAAAEMTEALLVNPYDVQRTAEVFYQALTLPEEERRTRLALLRERVMTRDVHAWAKDFIARLEQAAAKPASPALSPPGALRQALERARQAERLALLLDYDGTLVRSPAGGSLRRARLLGPPARRRLDGRHRGAAPHLARAGAGDPARVLGPYAGDPHRGEDGRVRLALSLGGSGVRRRPGEGAHASPSVAHRRPAPRDPARRHGARGAAARREQGVGGGGGPRPRRGRRHAPARDGGRPHRRGPLRGAAGRRDRHPRRAVPEPGRAPHLGRAGGAGAARGAARLMNRQPARSTGCGWTAGRSISKVEPSPASLVTRTPPPCASAMARTVHRPSPSPPY